LPRREWRSLDASPPPPTLTSPAGAQKSFVTNSMSPHFASLASLRSPLLPPAYSASIPLETPLVRINAIADQALDELIGPSTPSPPPKKKKTKNTNPRGGKDLHNGKHMKKPDDDGHDDDGHDDDVSRDDTNDSGDAIASSSGDKDNDNDDEYVESSTPAAADAADDDD